MTDFQAPRISSGVVGGSIAHHPAGLAIHTDLGFRAAQAFHGRICDFLACFQPSANAQHIRRSAQQGLPLASVRCWDGFWFFWTFSRVSVEATSMARDPRDPVDRENHHDNPSPVERHLADAGIEYDVISAITREAAGKTQ
jgi:hypothetical protein